MTDELVEFLRVRLDEDERLARKAVREPGQGSPAKVPAWSAYVEGGSDGSAVESADGKISFVVGGPLARAEHVARHGPARVLRKVEAKRRIIDLHAGSHDCPEFISGTYPDDWPAAAPYGKAGQPWEHTSTEHHEEGEPCPTLRLLAQPYVDHPDYRQEWAP